MPKHNFIKASELEGLIDTYFKYVEGEYHLEIKPTQDAKGPSDTGHKVWDRDPEAPTMAGLAFFLGFNSREAFDEYEKKGKFRHMLKRSRLRIEAIYEKKLHQQSSAGAIFALKNMGWNEKPDNKSARSKVFKSIKIEIVETGHKPAESEKEVVL